MATARREGGELRALRARLAEAAAPLEATLVGKPRLSLDAALQRVDELLAAVAAAASSSQASSSDQGSRPAAAERGSDASQPEAAEAPPAGQGGRGRAAAKHGQIGGGGGGREAGGQPAAAASAQVGTEDEEGAAAVAVLLARGSKQHLNALRIVRVKLLVERAAAAALAGSAGDTPECRQHVLSLLLAAQAEATQALTASLPHCSTMLLALTSGLAALTAGCSGGATDACLDSWEAAIAALERSAADIQQLSIPYYEVSPGQHPKALWPLDPPAGWSDQGRMMQFSLEARAAAMTLMRRAGFQLSYQNLLAVRSAAPTAGGPEQGPELSAAGQQQRQEQEQRGNSAGQAQRAAQHSAAQRGGSPADPDHQLTMRLNRVNHLTKRWTAVWLGVQGRRSAGSFADSPLEAAGGSSTAAEAAAEPQRFEDNERDRSLLQRLGLQPWLRAELRRQVAGRYPVPPGSPLLAEVRCRMGGGCANVQGRQGGTTCCPHIMPAAGLAAIGFCLEDRWPSCSQSSAHHFHFSCRPSWTMPLRSRLQRRKPKRRRRRHQLSSRQRPVWAR